MGKNRKIGVSIGSMNYFEKVISDKVILKTVEKMF